MIRALTIAAVMALLLSAGADAKGPKIALRGKPLPPAPTLTADDGTTSLTADDGTTLLLAR